MSLLSQPLMFPAGHHFKFAISLCRKQLTQAFDCCFTCRAAYVFSELTQRLTVKHWIPRVVWCRWISWEYIIYILWYIYYCWKSPNWNHLGDHGFMDVINTPIVRQPVNGKQIYQMIHKQQKNYIKNHKNTLQSIKKPCYHAECTDKYRFT